MCLFYKFCSDNFEELVLKIYPLLLFFRGGSWWWKHLPCHRDQCRRSKPYYVHTQLLDISINKTQLGGRKLEAHTQQWTYSLPMLVCHPVHCSGVQITRLAYKRCDYILFVAMAAYRQKGCWLLCCCCYLLLLLRVDSRRHTCLS